MLSLTVFMLLVAEIMPATSDSVPLIGESDTVRQLLRAPIENSIIPITFYISDHIIIKKQQFTWNLAHLTLGLPQLVFLFSSSQAQYFATTMVIVGLSVIATVWVLQYHYHDPDGGKMPRWVSCFVK